MDNLNPLFLYPEMSKQADVFTSLMQSLSMHLRPGKSSPLRRNQVDFHLILDYVQPRIHMGY